jgi:predicted Zn-dependent peptidase
MCECRGKRKPEMKRIAATTILLLLSCMPLAAQQVQVQEHVLSNGLKLLMVPRKGDPNVAAGWIAKVGSVNERPGITGVCHLFEHMMFKGTHVIGTRDIKNDLELLAEIDGVKAEIRKEEQSQIQRLRLGEISNLTDPENRTAHHQELLKQLEALQKREKDLIVKNEFDKIYTSEGASGMNAGTSHDFTVYFINVPANKLELWFWMESDRLLNPVFREFYSERDVVREERRLRTESTPTGKFEEEFDAAFWTSSPYLWPVVGWPSDLDGLTRDEALAFFSIYYAPNNLTACLVGDFDPSRAIDLAEQYFGRLKRNPHQPEPVRTREVEQLAEKRMIAYAETNPEVEVRYHTVADGHVDDYALTVMGSLLTGRTGRLYKSLVLDEKVANSASAGQDSLKYEGSFSLSGVAKPGNTPEQVEQALYREVGKLQKEKVPDHELQKVKNQFNAATFRRLQSNFGLMIQLLLADSGRGWQSFNEDPGKIQAVTADDIQRVANKYFKPENRAVAIYYTKKSEEKQENPLLTGLTEEERTQVNQFQGMLGKMSPEQMKNVLQQIEQQEGTAPVEKKKMIDVMKKLLQERMAKQGGDR